MVRGLYTAYTGMVNEQKRLGEEKLVFLQQNERFVMQTKKKRGMDIWMTKELF